MNGKTKRMKKRMGGNGVVARGIEEKNITYFINTDNGNALSVCIENDGAAHEIISKTASA